MSKINKIVKPENRKEAFRKASLTKYGKVYKYFYNNYDNIELFRVDTLDIIKQNSSSFAFTRCVGDVFGVCTQEFQNAFFQVVSGKGQEINNIRTLHSSALLGLLCFYSINEENPLIIDMPFNNEKVKFEFDRVEFEKTNTVFEAKYRIPSVLSSIDIALYGKANNKKAVLYLESKFSEYLNVGDYSSADKKKRYEQFYKYLSGEDKKEDQNFLKNCGVSYSYTNKKNTEDGKLHINNTDENKQHYCEGLKQMVSHTIGAVNSDEERREIYLAPILFDFGKLFDDPKDNAFTDYCDVYGKFAAGLKNLRDKLTTSNCYKDFFPDNNNTEAPLVRNKNKLFISDKVLSYQEFFKKTDFKLPLSVKEYYNL